MLETASIGFATAFVAGVVSFLSPCVLPLVPGYVSYVAGTSLEGLRDRSASRLRAVGYAVCFVLGFSVVFVAFGASATALGGLLLERLRLLSRTGRRLQRAAGAALAVAGVLMLTGQLETLANWLVETFPGFTRIG